MANPIFDLCVFVLLALGVGLTALSHRDLALPDVASDRLRSELSRAVAPGQADFEDLAIRWDETGPRAILSGLRILNTADVPLVEVPRLEVLITASELLQGRLSAGQVLIPGAVARVNRRADGRIDLGIGQGGGAALGSPTEALAAIEAVFSGPGFNGLQQITATDLTLYYSDDRSGRSWRIDQGRLGIENTETAVTMALSLALPKGERQSPPLASDSDEARMSARLNTMKDSSEAQLSFVVDQMPASDIAVQDPALAWLAPLRAPVSGSMIMGLDADGNLGPLNGRLELGAGTFAPDDRATPLTFDGARSYFAFIPQTNRIRFDELSVRSQAISLSATGHADLDLNETGWPQAMYAQLDLGPIALDLPQVFPGSAEFSGGVLDARIALDPFSVTIGQLVLAPPKPEDGGTERFSPLLATGGVRIGAEGWTAVVEAQTDWLHSDALMTYWPLPAAPRPRDWVDRNLQAAVAKDAVLGLELAEGQKPAITLSWQFEDGRLSILPNLPVLEEASGRAVIARNRLAITLHEGGTRPPEGGWVDMSGASFVIADTDRKPPEAQLIWASESSILAALSLLDQPPFRLMEKAGRPVDLAEGQVEVSGKLTFPIQKRIPYAALRMGLEGRLSDVSSEALITGRTLEAEKLDLGVTETGMTIGGEARLDSIPLSAVWSAPLGQPGGVPRVEGDITVDDAFRTVFLPVLPETFLAGRGLAQFTLDLPQDAPPELRLESDLAGLSSRLPQIGWSLSPAQTGTLVLDATLGQPAQVDALELQAPGLRAEGAVALREDGNLDTFRLTGLRAGSWLDAAVTLRGRGAGRAPNVSVEGGRMDLTAAPFGSGAGSVGGGGRTSLRLDQLRLSPTIALTAVSAELETTSAGLSGQFSGRVNGGPRVSGTLAPGAGGRSGIRLSADNAGAVLGETGLLQEATGGDLTLVLRPRGTPGHYDGRLEARGVRVQSAPELAALLNVISVVGLIDQMNGAGLLFSEITADFVLTPTALQVTAASAVGPSLGISADGFYDMKRETLDMQGVLSPIYAVNGLGQLFTRRGEGLFGVNYRMTGPVAAPRISVNPLSMLTPGMFRQIFRTAPPRAPTPTE